MTKVNKNLVCIVLLILAIGVAYYFGSRNSTGNNIQHSYNLPTATEIFNLRSACAALGQKMLDKGTDIGNGMAQSQLSHYNSTTNRCYVVLKSTLTNSSGNDFRENLYDGQTGELLANGIDQTGKGAIHFGQIGNDPSKITPTPSSTAFDIVDEYITGVISDDAKASTDN